MIILIILWLLFGIIFTSIGLGGGPIGFAMIGVISLALFWIVVLACHSQSNEGKRSAKKEYDRQKRYENEYGIIKWDSKDK